MSFLLEKVGNLHAGLRETLFGRNDGGLQLPNGLDGPDGNGPLGDGPDFNGPGLDSLPPGLQQRGGDSIPPGIAKQLDPGTVHVPPGQQSQPGNPAQSFPVPPARPDPGGNFPATPTPPGGGTPPPMTGQPVPITGGPAPSLPVTIGAPPLLPGNSSPPLLSQIPQFVQSLFGQSNAAAPAMAAARANPAAAVATPPTANPVPPTVAAAQTAQTTPTQLAAPTQLPGTPGQVPASAANAAAQGTTVNPNAPNTATSLATRGGAETVPQQAPQGRPDVVPVLQQREASLIDRLMSLLRPNATTTTPQGTLAANAAGTTAAQAAAGTTMAAMPLAVQATQPPMDARGNTLLAVNDRVAAQRPDATMTGVYTADGPYRRALRRGSNVLSARFSNLLMALGLAGPPVTMRGRDAEYELSVAMQWLFWLLAIVAYACLGLAVIAFLPAGSEVFGGGGRAWTGGFAIAGLVAAAGAWWFARQLSGRGGSRDGQRLEEEPDAED